MQCRRAADSRSQMCISPAEMDDDKLPQPGSINMEGIVTFPGTKNKLIVFTTEMTWTCNVDRALESESVLQI